MSEYRAEYAALQGRTEAVRAELDETKRALDEARTLAHVHEASCATLRKQLRESRSSKRPAAALSVTVIVALSLGVGGFLGGFVLRGSRSGDGTKLERVMRLSAECESARVACEQDSERARATCDDAMKRMR